MTITSTGLTRAAGVAATVAGAIFVAVQIKHPPMTVATVETTQWVVRETAKTAMAGLALAGITGMYLRQYRRVGVLGLAGYVIFAFGYLTMFAVEAIAAVVLPQLTTSNPGYVQDVLTAAFGGKPTGDIGGMQTLLNLNGFGYLVGGLLFGIALFRSGVLARWAAALLAIGAAATAALAVLPDSFNRPFAVPVGIALVGLGVSLWRNAHTDTSTSATSSSATARVEPAVR